MFSIFDLGGGLAKLAGIVSNKTDALISFSGPGISYARTKLKDTRYIDKESINRRTINIYNDRDIVPQADKQEGLIQLVTCPQQFSFTQCHAILPFFCNVVKLCGNPRQFRINQNICIPRRPTLLN